MIKQMVALSFLNICLSLGLSGCGQMQSVSDFFTNTTYRYNEENTRLPEDQFIERQYDALYHSNVDVVVNKTINLCDYNKLLFVRISNHSTWLTDSVRNSVMKNLNKTNDFFKTIR